MLESRLQPGFAPYFRLKPRLLFATNLRKAVLSPLFFVARSVNPLKFLNRFYKGNQSSWASYPNRVRKEVIIEYPVELCKPPQITRLAQGLDGRLPYDILSVTEIQTAFAARVEEPQ